MNDNNTYNNTNNNNSPLQYRSPTHYSLDNEYATFKKYNNKSEKLMNVKWDQEVLNLNQVVHNNLLNHNNNNNRNDETKQGRVVDFQTQSSLQNNKHET